MKHWEAGNSEIQAHTRRIFKLRTDYWFKQTLVNHAPDAGAPNFGRGVLNGSEAKPGEVAQAINVVQVLDQVEH